MECPIEGHCEHPADAATGISFYTSEIFLFSFHQFVYQIKMNLVITEQNKDRFEC